MTEPPASSVLARIVAAHNPARKVKPGRDEAASRMLSRALRHAAAPFKGVRIETEDATFQAEIDLADAIAALPGHGLVAALEDDAGRRGLLGVCTNLIDALIEAQTTGRIEQAALPPRPVTRIDEALSRDFFDLVLASIAKEGADVPGRDWPPRMRYGSRFSDRSQINLLLPDGPYRQFVAKIKFVGTDRTAQFFLTLPADPALAQADDGPRSGMSPEADAAWSKAMTQAVGNAPLSLEAVLMRSTLSFGEVARLAEGDVLPFDQVDLNSVSLEDGAGRALLNGRLGQLRGKRAIRVGGGTALSAGAPAAAPPAPAAPPAAQELPTPSLAAAAPLASATPPEAPQGLPSLPTLGTAAEPSAAPPSLPTLPTLS